MNNKDKYILFLSGAVLGVILYLIFFGINTLDFTYTDWLIFQDSTDLAQHYLGWVEYRASDWHFPIGLIENIQYPNMVSVVYTDSIPLFAIFFKLFSSILPEHFQYFGLFGIICYALQGGFATVFLYHFTKKKVFSIIASLFCSGSIIIMYRMFYHTSLSAQWLIIASLYLWLCKEEQISDLRSILYWTLLSTIATLTHIYFLPMIWGCMLCDALGQALSYKYKRGILSIFASGICMLLTGWITGLFYQKASFSDMIYGIYSFNLNGFWNSFDYGRFFSKQPVISDWQEEGLAYLGLGMLILTTLCIILGIFQIVKKIIERNTAILPIESDSSPENNDSSLSKADDNSQSIKRNRKKIIRQTIPFLVFVVGFGLLSTSNIISFNDHAVYIPIPESVKNVLAVFRCNGRFIWPIYNILLLFVCIGIDKLIKYKYIPEIILVLSLILQAADLSPLIQYNRERFAPSERIRYESLLTDPAWEECANRYSHIMFYPNVRKIISGAKITGCDLQIFACENHMSVNMANIARVSTDQVNQEVYDHFDQLQHGYSDPDTMYVFLDELPADLCGLHYYYLDNIIIATPDALDSTQEITLTNSENIGK